MPSMLEEALQTSSYMIKQIPLDIWTSFGYIFGVTGRPPLNWIMMIKYVMAAENILLKVPLEMVKNPYALKRGILFNAFTVFFKM